MATDGNIDAGAPNLNLTQEEKRVYGHLFRQADINNLGVVTGEVAVKFFEKTALNSRVLGEIWQIADKENRGFLTPAGFGIVLRLIGHAQAGREPSPEMALNPGPLPRFEGVNIPPPPPMQSRPPPTTSPSAGLTPATTGGGLSSISAQGPGGAPIQIPALTAEKATQYANLFERQTLQSGQMLPGDAAKSIFEKSGLPNEVLGRIWQLADTEQRGALVMTEFVMSMHLLTCMKSGALRALPTILPAPLYEAATQRLPARGSPVTAIPPVPPIPKQLSGTAQQQTQMRTGSPLARQPLAPPPQISSHSTGVSRVTPQGTGMAGGDWLVTPTDKTRFDQVYGTIDITRKGFITGEEAVGFFGQSNLNEDQLAQIWDLADINSKGQLTRDEFAVAMYLIRQQRTRRDGTNTLPSTLPPNLIPPSMRSSHTAPAPVGAFDTATLARAPAPPAQPKSALDDLFGLTTSPSSSAPAPAQVQSAMATGGSNASRDPFSSGSPMQPGSPMAPISSQATSFGTSIKPFMPTSSFGLSLTPNKTGESTGSAPAQLQVPAPIEEDLLGDNDPEISKKLTNETTELANMSSQIGTLSKQMQDLSTKRNSTQQELTQASSQKKQLESKLAHLRTMYENEAREVRSLEQQLNTAKADTKNLQKEYVMLEATATDLRNNKNLVLTGLQADQQENASLKEKIRAVNAETTAIKPQLEKLKSEARQQKGLVAINKKQLSTNEGERDKLKSEAEELSKSNEEMSRQIGAGSPASTSAQVASPTLSTTSANNPFFRRTASTDVVGTFGSPPPVKSVSDNAFNDIFGPFPLSATSTPPPTSFKKAETTSTTSPFATPGSASPQLSRQAPATSGAEPPAPAESNQITSSFLPIREPADSISSSRQVSPPASRIGFADATPTEPSGGLRSLSPDATGRSIGSGSGVAVESDKEGPKPAATFPQENKLSIAEDMFDAPPSSSEAALNRTNTAPVDPFASMDKTNAKDAFDDAFASFGTSKAEDKSAFDSAFAGFGSSSDKGSDGGPAGKTVAAFNTEFPPISEIEGNDESDSDSDKGGFDDDFAPATSSPNTKSKEKTGGDAVAGATTGAPASSPATEETPKSETSTITSMPSTNAAPAPTALTSTTSTAPNMENIFSNNNNPPSVTPTTAQHGPSGSVDSTSNKKPSTPFDELDDEFEGLEDAKEGSADDEYANISRSGLDDFNPVFDSSPPPSQAKSESTAFGAESSFDFANVSEGSSGQLGSARGHAQQHAQGQGQAVTLGGTALAAVAPPAQSGDSKAPISPDNQDWEALFASLDSPGSDGTATATARAPAATAESVGGPGSAAAGTGSEKPAAIGRALTEEGLHDEPTLKQLVSMGYERSDALAALEKSNYDAERVSTASKLSSPVVVPKVFEEDVKKESSSAEQGICQKQDRKPKEKESDDGSWWS
ncbi:UBA/TS-N domain-containing protein [Zalerion maritima]|uniref:UBA/TS-N domain-containing protein n=1 Tax=Zalerion maritima TaxID=339359 RepID=A0AAD5RXE3_9PEZI|nr:UBA/TS-N domain-containing protein [Zalerion maritima]